MSDDDIQKRLDRLESLVEDQQETIEAQRERLSAVDQSVETHDTPVSVSRRTALQTGSVLGLLGLGVGTANADPDPSGQIGTEDRPLNALYTTTVNGPLTNGERLSNLTGDNLTISDGALHAVDTTSDSPAETSTIYVTVEDSSGNTLLNQTEILSYFHDINVPVDDRTGERTGNPRQEMVEFVKIIDGASPQLHAALADNSSLSVEFEFFDDTEQQYFTIILSGAKINGLGTSDPGLEDVRMTFDSITWRHQPTESETTMTWASQ